MSKYDDMDYLQLCKVRDNTKSPRELRIIHKAFKMNGYPGGVDFVDRHPNLPLAISITSLLLVSLKPVLVDILQWLQIWISQ